MISSMTAFATHEVTLPEGILRWDIKSVNHRYCEVSFKVPDEFQNVESSLRELIRKKINRGKIYCNFYFDPNRKQTSSLGIDFELVDQLVSASDVISQKLKTATPPSAFDILKWPAVVKTLQQDTQTITEAMKVAFEETLNAFMKERLREGKELKAFIEQRLTKMKAILTDIRSILPQILVQYREHLLEKVNELQVQIDPHRLEQELMLIAQKMDVSEEMDRIEAHLRAVQTLLTEGGVVGRHLDFFMQELNRETNTLASKSINAAVTQQTVELKVLIEQMREQIQNLE